MAAVAVLTPALRCSLGRHRALSGSAGRCGRRPFPVDGASLRPCSTRAAPDGVNKAVIDRIIRVDHAGEYGANRIYAGQMAVLGRSTAGPLIQQMWNQEKEHLKKFNELMIAYRVRPTVLLPFWNVAGFVLDFTVYMRLVLQSQGLEALYLERRVQWLAQWLWKRAYQTTITTRSEL